MVRLLVVHLILGVGYAQAQDEAKALVEKAIKAQGGEAKVAKLKVMNIKVKGKMTFPGLFKVEIDFLIDDTWQLPAQYKSVMRLKLDGKDVEITKVVNGDKGWVSGFGMVQPMTKENLAEQKEQNHAEDLERLGFLQDNRYSLSTTKDSIFSGKLAVGVKITSKGHRDVTLYFDRSSGLLIGRRHIILEGGKEILQDVSYEDFKDHDGLKHYTRLVGKRDGKTLLEGEVVEIKFFEKLDDKVFAQP